MKSNKIVVALLLVGTAACLWFLPWSEWFGGPGSYERRLTARVQSYCELRQQDDWAKIYELMDLRDRAKVPIARFMALYGAGAIKVHDLQSVSQTIDSSSGVADVELSLTGELVLDRLPAKYRQTLTGYKPDDLRKEENFQVQWSWSDGDWWLRMDRQAVTGRTPDGRRIKTSSGR